MNDKEKKSGMNINFESVENSTFNFTESGDIHNQKTEIKEQYNFHLLNEKDQIKFQKIKKEFLTEELSDEFKDKKEATSEDEYKFDVFISYRHKERDAEFVNQVLVPILDKAGVEYFLDKKDTVYGDVLSDVLDDALTQSRKIIIILTPEYLESAWTKHEAMIARHLDPDGTKKKIIGILLAESSKMPVWFESRIYLDWTQPITKAEIEKLLRSIYS